MCTFPFMALLVLCDFSVILPVSISLLCLQSDAFYGFGDDGDDGADEDISKIRTKLTHRKEKKGKKLDAQVSALLFINTI